MALKGLSDIFKPEDLIKELNYNKLFEGMIVDYIN